MHRNYWLGIGVLIILTVSSCSQSTVEEDMEEYCECRSDFDRQSSGECITMADDIIQKYEYDAQASEYIKKALIECDED